MTSSGLSTTAYKIQRDEETPAAEGTTIPFVVLGGLTLGLQGDTETIEDQEITNTRGLVDATPVDRLASGSTSHVLRYGPYDPLFALALQPDDGPADSGPHTKGVFVADGTPASGGALVFPPAAKVGPGNTVFGPFASGIAVASTTLTRSDGGSWLDDGHLVGRSFSIGSAEVGANNGIYIATTVTATVLTASAASFDNTGSPDTTMTVSPLADYAINGSTGVITGTTGSAIEDGFEVGFWGYLESITVAPGGATVADLERIPFKVLALGTNAITVQFLIAPTTGTWRGQLVRASQIADGSQAYAATIEQLYDRSADDDDKRYQVITNAKIGTMEVSVERKQAVTLNLGWNGKDADPKYYHPDHSSPPTGWAEVPSGGTYVLHPSAGNPSMAPIYNRGFLWFGDKDGAVIPGSAVGFKARSVRVNVDNQIQPDGNLFEEGSSEIDSLDIRVRTDIVAVMSVAAHAVIVANRDWADAEMAIAIPDGNTGNMYIIDLPAGRIATATAPIPAKGNKITVSAQMISRIATAEKKFFGTTVDGDEADFGVSIRVIKVPAPA